MWTKMARSTRAPGTGPGVGILLANFMDVSPVHDGVPRGCDTKQAGTH
jgi:hypothetical protein